MSKYIVWHCINEAEKIIEILNECDLSSIQQECLEKGYIIVKIDYAFDRVFMKVVKKDE